MKQNNKTFLKNLLTPRFIFTLVGLGMIGFSAYYNILYFTADMPSWQDWYGAFAGAAFLDVLKAIMALSIPVLWAGRKYIFLVLALVSFAGTTGLSLYAAHSIKLKQQLIVSALKQKVQDSRNRITQRYLKADKAMSALKMVTPLADVQQQLKTAIKQIETTRVWRSSSQCMNATIQKSKNICQKVNALRAALPKAAKRRRAEKELALATLAVSQLSPLSEVRVSKQTQQLVAWLFAILLEIGSSLLLPLSRLDFAQILAVHGRKHRHKGQQARKAPQEVQWIAAMKQAATDENHAKVVFDKEGLLKAPYGALAKVWGIKSSSTAGQRLQRLKALGYLEVTGSQRNMRYRLLEAI